jgi:hypothetical protein
MHFQDHLLSVSCKIELTSTYEASLFTKIINHIYAVAHCNLVHKHDANIFRVATL